MAWTVVVCAPVLPPQGFGIRVCMFQAWTDAPCPGCGLTRALSSAARGLFEQSWHVHPFGVPLLLLFALIAAVSVLPRSWRHRIASGMSRHRRPVNVAYVGFVGAFVVYGVARAIAHTIG